jgi:hypothetical protein
LGISGKTYKRFADEFSRIVCADCNIIPVAQGIALLHEICLISPRLSVPQRNAIPGKTMKTTQPRTALILIDFINRLNFPEGRALLPMR